MKQRQILTCNAPLIGSRISLQRLGPEHTGILLESFTNDAFWGAYRAGQKRSIGSQQLREQLEFEYQNTPAQNRKIEWVIKDNLSKTAVGLASLSAFDASQSRAEFMIGFFEKEYLRFGLGLEASLLIFDYAFNIECLHKLTSLVYLSNPSAQENTLALGFKQEGLLRTHTKMPGHNAYSAAFQNGMLASEFRDNTRLARLSLRLLRRDITATPASPQNDDATSWSASFKLN